MRNKTQKIMIIMIVMFLSIVMMTSCANKRGQVSETFVPKTNEVTSEQIEEAGAVKEEDMSKSLQEAELERSQVVAREMKAFETNNIYFAFDNYTLTEEARLVLKEKADWLYNNPAYSVKIEGHCDERGTNEYNLALGERRARVAKDYLVTSGIAEDRISTISYGEERPADSLHNEESWAKNRRDEFKLSK